MGIYIFIGILAVIVDQISKLLVQRNMYGSEISIIDNFFSLTYVENFGAAWGIFSEWDFLLKILPPVLVGVILVYLYKCKPGKIEVLSGTLVIGGAIGNFIDRIRLGYVIDFIDFKFWPVFNFADIWIVVGCFLMIITLFRKEDKDGN